LGILNQLAKRTKNKVGSTESSKKLFLGHPHPTFPKNKKQSWFHKIIRKAISGASPPNLPKEQKTKSIPQNYQKNYFCGT
jgi:hypothetical protein